MDNLKTTVQEETVNSERKGKEVVININDNIITKYGSTNRHNPKIVYFIGRLWAKPLYKGRDYVERIDEVFDIFRKNMVAKLKQNHHFDSSRYVFDTDAKTSLMKENKKSFITFEAHLKQTNLLTFKEAKVEVESLFQGLLEDLSKDFKRHNFEISKAKRD